MNKGNSTMVTPVADGNFWNYLSSLLGAVVVLLLAWYKDSRTHKRIDSHETWISRVEEKNDTGIKEMTSIIQVHTDNFKENYPNNDALDKALKPISEGLERSLQLLITKKTEELRNWKKKINY